jgi:hypothetical protein
MSMTVRAEGLDRVIASLGRFSATKAFTAWADGAAPRIAAGLRDYAPVGKERAQGADATTPHRHLKDSFRYVRHTAFGFLQVIFTSDVPQARFVIEGTKPHAIDPRPSNPRQLLAWYDEQGWHHARHVDHPGTRANPFPTHYVQLHRLELQSEFVRAVERTFHATLGGL